jgi:hypothetical protein
MVEYEASIRERDRVARTMRTAGEGFNRITI